MKKLNILKTIVDLFWIFSTLLTPIILITIPYILFVDNSSFLDIKIMGFDMETIDFPTRIFMVSQMLSYLILIYCLYIFREILEYFVRNKIFDDLVLKNFNKIGFLLVICSFLEGISSMLYSVFFKEKVTIELGFSPFGLLLCMGLFFMILSEIFKISKIMKDENQLTI